MGYSLTFHDITDEAEGKERNLKTKFTCPSCGANAWGKPELHIDCRDCHLSMEVG
jgi:transcription elongation factor Elf1